MRRNCSSGAIQLIDSTGHIIWSHELPYLPENVILGGAGTIYATYSEFLGNYEYMVGLDESTGAVRFEKTLLELGIGNLFWAGQNGIATYGEAFAGTPAGAVAVSGGDFTYINATGEVLHTGTYPLGADPLAAVNATGEILTTYLIPNTGISEEVEHEPAQGHGTLIASDGSTRWSHALTLPGNYASRPLLAAAPNDVWVLIDEDNDALDGVLPTVIAISGTDGSTLWTKRPLPLEKNSSLSFVGVDVTGHLYVSGREPEPCTETCEPECSYTCTYRHEVLIFNTDTGEYGGRTEVPLTASDSNRLTSIGGGQLAQVAEPIEPEIEDFHPARLQSYRLSGSGASYPPPPESPGAFSSYVALGDSVAAGEGIGYGWRWNPTDRAWEDGDTDGTWDTTFETEHCHQTTQGFPHVAASVLNAGLTDFACTGASSLHGILGERVQKLGPIVQWTAPAQLGSSIGLTGAAPPNPAYDAAKPDLVSLTIGADDVGFSDKIEECYTPPALKLCSTDPHSLDDKLSEEANDLNLVLEEIHRRGISDGRNPLVVVTQYHDPFPAYEWGCPDITPAWPFFYLTNERLGFLTAGLARLNHNIAQVATTDHALVLNTSLLVQEPSLVLA